MSETDRLTAEQVTKSLDAMREQIEKERRERFAPFGVPSECLWPSSRVFHDHSSLGPAWKPALSLEEIERHTRNLEYRRYLGAPRITLPTPSPPNCSLSVAMSRRRSSSKFSSRSLALADIALLLGVGAGVTCGGEIPKRAAPSGGALFPIETYALAFGVDGLSTGVYHYLPLEHQIEHVRALSGIEIARRFLPPGLFEARPPLILALTAVFRRTQIKYLERGYRFALIEAGHLAQNFLLLATAAGFGAVPVGGYWDEPFNEALGLDPTQEAVVYSILVGHQLSEREEAISTM